MKTVFFGSPPAALPSFRALLGAGHSVELVVTQPDKPAGRGRRLVPSAVKAFAAGRGIPVIEPARIRTDLASHDRIRAAGPPDVNVVVAYGQIIPNAVHYFPRFHSINVHFSLLPKYRGAAPVQWTVLNGDAESGVTIIELNDRMDKGDVLAQERAAVGPRETALALETRLAEIGAKLLVETLDRIGTIERVKQDDSMASLAPKIHKEDGRLSWADAAEAVDRKVLALGDRPGVFSRFRGRRIGVIHGRILESERTEGDPGRIFSVGKAGLAVACGGGSAYLIEELQPEGKAVMSAYAFSLGTKIAPGDSMG
jgi:methionyl-tRNA formyltransferase